MLTELLHLVENAPRPYLMDDLCRMLHAQPSAVEGMIELLIRRGRIIEIGPDDRPCAHCALQGACDLPVQYGRRFVTRRPTTHCILTLEETPIPSGAAISNNQAAQ